MALTFGHAIQLTGEDSAWACECGKVSGTDHREGADRSEDAETSALFYSVARHYEEIADALAWRALAAAQDAILREMGDAILREMGADQQAGTQPQ